MGSSPTQGSIFMLDIASTFISIFLTNVFYTYYIKAVQKHAAFLASWWSLVISVCASVAVINYTENHWMLVPACLGSFFGTYAGMLLAKKN